MKRAVLAISAALLLSSAARAQSMPSDLFPSSEPRADSSAAWTVMVYLAADNNLDPFAVGDIEEMEQVGSSDQLRIVVLVDRADYDSEWSTARRALVQHAPAPGVQSLTPSDTCTDLGEIDTGAPETLRGFVTWAAATYPARRYALILWNHGGGWRALDDLTTGAARGGYPRGLAWVPTPQSRYVCSDDDSGNKICTRHVREALEATGVRFDLIAYDACVMGMVEVAYEMRGLTDYTVASQQNIPGEGFSYTPFLSRLNAAPSMDAAALGAAIIEAYDATYSDEPDCTLALVQSSALGGLVERLNGFVREIAAAQNAPAGSRALPLGEPLKAVRRDAGPEMGDAYNRLPYVDLGCLLASASGADALPEAARTAAAQALEAYRAAVPLGMRAQEKRRSGLAIFFPESLEYEHIDEQSTDAYTADNLEFARDCLWAPLVRAFAYNEPLPDLGRHGNETPDVSTHEPTEGLTDLFDH